MKPLRLLVEELLIEKLVPLGLKAEDIKVKQKGLIFYVEPRAFRNALLGGPLDPT